MSDHDLTPREAGAARLVRDYETPAADPVFRGRLRAAFLSGRFADEVTDRVVVPRPAGRTDVAWWRRPAARWSLAAVAALVVASAVMTLNRAPAFELIEARGEGIAVVDGRPISLDHADQLAGMMRAGARVRVPDGGSISIVSPGLMALELAGGSDLTIPRPPGRWFGRSSYAEVNRGIMRITTGSAFRGARLHVETPAADVDVMGTTLAVICEPVGTCVCVLEGTVEVGRQGGEMAEVGAGRRRFVFLDGTDETDVMRESEAVSLEALRNERSALLER